MRRTFLFLALVCSLTLSAQPFLTTSGKMIVDPKGKEVILRGLGIGGWMLQEPYMFETSRFTRNQQDIRAKIEELVGPEKTRQFYQAWLNNFCTLADIDSLASWGYNSIRLPMHYNLYTLPAEKEPVPGEQTWIETGFTLTDSLLAWCAANHMYLILDLHAAPGGQGNDIPISDRNTSLPSLWESTANQEKTIALWKKLAERYANSPWIGGYDLINEPNWNFEGKNKNGCEEQNNQPLWDLQKKITGAIREVDPNHIIIIEGNCWGNNYRGLPPLWDNKIVCSFHKYWNANSTSSIQWVLDMRDSLNVPFWLGESGENSNHWFTDCIRLMESNHIGWAFWPLKKTGSVTGTLTINKPAGYQQLLNYWNGRGEKPSPEQAWTWLQELTQSLHLKGNIIHYDVIDAMFRQPSDKSTRPYKKHAVPCRVNCADYDLGQNGIAYFDSTYQNIGRSRWNQGSAYRNDGVDISACEGSQPAEYYVSWTLEGEFLQYTVEADKKIKLPVYVCTAAEKEGGKLRVELNGKILAEDILIPATGGKEKWQVIELPGAQFTRGKNVLRLIIVEGGFSLKYVDLGKI
ncbi:MAG: cellulase family glycosylhydrolase [Bacteroidales bacterium]